MFNYTVVPLITEKNGLEFRTFLSLFCTMSTEFFNQDDVKVILEIHGPFLRTQKNSNVDNVRMHFFFNSVGESLTFLFWKEVIMLDCSLK